MPRQDDARESLQALGFTQVESAIYTALLEHGPSTGYRAGQLAGKPTPNAYKALRSLADKGAAVVEEGDPELWRAVPASDLLREIDARHARSTERAREALDRLATPSDDARLYQLQSLTLARTRALEIAAGAESCLLVDGFPALLDPLAETLIEAAGRGVRTRVKAYAEIELPGVDVHVAPDRERVLEVWPGSILSMVADGRETLVVTTDRDADRLLRGLWTRSRLLSCMWHNLVAMEVEGAWRQARAIERGDDAELPGLHLTQGDVPGFQELIAELEAQAEPTSARDE